MFDKWSSKAEKGQPGGTLVLLELLLVLTAIATPLAGASTYTVLHTFNGTGGANPQLGSLIRDAAGNLYGTTSGGGTAGAGVVYKVHATGHETVLYNFCSQTNCTDGAYPYAGVIRDSAGNLYGTTYDGGAGYGVVYKLDNTGKETVLYTFTGGADGGYPKAGVIRDSAGNLYGTTSGGGHMPGCGNGGPSLGCGVVYKLDTTGKLTVLYTFSGGADGGDPEAGVTQDSAGNLYGATFLGGSSASFGGYGVVYKLHTTGKETVLYTFTGGADGANPVAGVILDSSGNLYGTAAGGGNVPGCGNPGPGCGVVYKLDNTGKETVLYTFTGGTDGATPLAGVIRESNGNLYGTTGYGGTGQCSQFFPFPFGCGVVYKLDTAGKETVLYTFTDGTDGGVPMAGVIRDSAGNLYGATPYGGNSSASCSLRVAPTGCGVVFKLKP